MLTAPPAPMQPRFPAANVHLPPRLPSPPIDLWRDGKMVAEKS